MKKRILLIGSICTELNFKASGRTLAKEEKIDCGDYDLAPGGSAGIGAIAVSRLGGGAILCGCVGNDEYGRSLVGFFKDLGVDTRFVKTVKDSKTDISVVADGDERVTYRRNALTERITCDLVEEAFTSFPDAVYVSLDVPKDVAILAASLAREKGIPSFFDGERVPEDFPLADLGVIDVIALPPHATERITGISPRDTQSNLRAAVELHKTVRSKTYLFKFGVGGAFAYKGNFSYYIPYIEDADERYRDLLVPAMIVENLRSAKSVRATRYAATVIEIASKKGNTPAVTIPSETEVLRYILEQEVEL
ncbi:MAG: carbohydrate kinase family protein [Clostridia bacterium]|nr:carbohydrate kinase family protein [Clostridia bacterium]